MTVRFIARKGDPRFLQPLDIEDASRYRPEDLVCIYGFDRSTGEYLFYRARTIYEKGNLRIV